MAIIECKNVCKNFGEKVALPGMMPLPIMVKTIPKTICNEPTAQNHGPNLVQFFLVKKVMYAV